VVAIGSSILLIAWVLVAVVMLIAAARGSRLGDHRRGESDREGGREGLDWPAFERDFWAYVDRSRPDVRTRRRQ
jgi:hypothetical protein